MEDIKAQAWTWQQKGEPTDLVLKEKQLRVLSEDEVLIQNTVIGLNPVDWKFIEWGSSAWHADIVPGVDATGIIVAVGSKMTHLRIGSRVCYHTSLAKDGSFSTHTIVSGFALMTVPSDVSDYAAAAFPCPGLTAYQALKKIPDIAGKNVLVSGAGGSVGYCLTQLLITSNAKVFVTASEQHHKDFIDLGVVKAIDYKNLNWVQTLSDDLGEGKFDAVFDTVNGKHAASLASLLGYYGHLVSIQDRVETNPVNIFTTCVSLHEVALGAFHQYASRKQIASLMNEGEHLLKNIGNGILKQREYSIESFANLPQHLAKMKKDNSSVKYLVKIS